MDPHAPDPAVTSLKADFARNTILQWIREGRYAPGEKLPPERTLAAKLEMSHLTVRSSLKQLVKEGVIVKQPRVGNFVNAVRTGASARHVAVILPRYLLNGEGRHPAMMHLLDGVTRTLDQRHYAITTLGYDEDALWRDAGEVAMHREARGVLLLPSVDVTALDVARFQAAGIKAVMLHRISYLLGRGLPCVMMDAVAPMVEALWKLIELGHQRIVTVCYASSLSREYAKQAIAAIAKQSGLAFDQMVFHLPNSPSHGVDLPRLAEIFQHNPTAVVVPDEAVAAELFRLCYARRIAVPDDLSIVAQVDNTPRAHPVRLAAPDTPAL